MPGAGSVGLYAQFSAGIEDARPVHGLSQLVENAHRLLTGQVLPFDDGHQCLFALPGPQPGNETEPDPDEPGTRPSDAAGLAEMRFGAGKGHLGLVLIVTLGTGIGTSLFINQKLVPNTELGHIELHGKDAEKWAAERVRIEKKLSWKKWALRVNEYLRAMEALLWPDLIIIGGGASKKHDRFFPYLTVKVETVPAQLRNEAGIVGAALSAPGVK